MLATAVAVVCFGEAARRIGRAVLPRCGRATALALDLVIGAALLCSAYGLLGQLSTRHAAGIELVFHGDANAAPRDSTTSGPGEVRVIEDVVTHARATPAWLAVIAIGVLALSFALRWPARRTRDRLQLVTLLAALPIVLAGLAALRSTARGYDALWYHLPIAATFLRTSSLEPAGRDLVFYFPANLELLARTLGDLFGARAMPLVQWPFALALAALTTGLARRIGAGDRAWVAGALVLACPIVAFQAGLGYADVVSTAAIVAGVLLSLRAIDEARLGVALTAGLAFGLSLGCKYAALPLLATGLPVIFVVALSRNRKAALPILALLVAGMIVPAWFWYARNARLTGNPFFPIAIPELGLRGLFLPRAFNAGKEWELVRARWEWPLYPWLETLSHESGFGAAFATLVPISLVPLARLVVRRRLPRVALPFGWSLVYLASWWLGTPHEVRHLLPLVPLLGASATLLLRGRSSTANGLARVGTLAIAASIVIIVRIQLFSPVPELSLFATSFADLYAIPPQVLDALPRGARVANLAGRPYNLALLGQRGDLALYDYAPGTTSDGELAYRRAGYVFVRGDEAEIASIRTAARARSPWRVVYEGRVSADLRWHLWGARATDTVVLFARNE